MIKSNRFLTILIESTKSDSKMRIGFTTGYLYEYTIDQILDIADEVGAQAIEFQPELYHVNFNLIDLKEMKEKLIEFKRNTGIEVTIHLPFLDVNLLAYFKEIRDASKKIILKWLDFAREVKITRATMHIGHSAFGIAPDKENYLWINMYKNMIPYVSEILKQSNKYNIKIGIENLPNKPGRFPVKKEHFDLLDESIEFYITFDIAHAKFMEENEINEFFSKYGDRIINVHISNSVGNVDHYGIDSGDINFEKFLTPIKQVADDLTIILEIDAYKVPGALFNKEIRLRELRKNIKLLREMLD